MEKASKIKNLRIIPDRDKIIANAVFFAVIEKGLASKINVPYLIKDGKEIEIPARNKTANFCNDPLVNNDHLFSFEQVTKIGLENSVRFGIIIINLINEFEKEFPETEWELLIPKYCIVDFYEREENN
jgi:hypothetical protein